MKIMIDTNIIISAVLFPHGRVAHALIKALQPPYEPLLCDYIVDELHRKFLEKFPARYEELCSFLSTIRELVCIVPTPTQEVLEEQKIRDPKDRPILRAAINEHAELFLTGDKDFLEAAVSDPRILSVSEFLSLQEPFLT